MGTLRRRCPEAERLSTETLREKAASGAFYNP
jgi:hypothetical protein